MQKALILGVGSAQADAIKYLKKTGWFVIGCSYKEEGSGLDFVDQFELVDIKDEDTVYQLGRSEKVDLVYSVGSDIAVPVAAKVSLMLALPSFVKSETAEIMQDKLKFRRFLHEHNLDAVKFKEITNTNALETWNKFPAIIKPADSQGQRGIFRVNTLDESRTAFFKSRVYSRTNRVILEEYLHGPEISVNAFVINSKIVFIAISDRLVVSSPQVGIPKGHIFPTMTCSMEQMSATKSLIIRCIEAFHIENGPLYFQLKLTEKGPSLIEATPRLDGCHLWRLIKSVCQIDLLKASFQLLIGNDTVDLDKSHVRSRVHLGFFHSPPDILFQIVKHSVPARAFYGEYYYKDGEKIKIVNGYLEKVGYYLEEID